MVTAYETGVETNLPAPAIMDTLDDLEQRLERGLRIIDQREASGLSVDRHEMHWLALLKQYEALYDSLT